MTAMRSVSKTLPVWLENFRSVQVRALDTRRHALIEASAGTGKTFAIEHLVLRLLVENAHWNPEEILLLSFTEKTVAELRDRIRRLLRAQIDDSDPGKKIIGWSAGDLERIRQVWLHADDLSVQTLHAFCQSSLRRDPVANHALIRTELTDDWVLADIALDRLMRGGWSANPARLQQFSDALGISAGDDWRKRLIRLALKWQPWRNDTLDPSHDDSGLEELEHEAEVETRELTDAVTALDRGTFPIGEYRKSFQFTKTGKVAAKGDESLRAHAYEKVFQFVERERQTNRNTTPSPRETLLFFRKQFRSNAKAIKNGWETEIPSAGQGLPEWMRLASLCKALRARSLQIEEARRRRKLGLTAEAARELRAALDAEKIRRGLISYEDMPRNLVEALRRNPVLADRLGSRYKACIVDEFQDTDPLQWEILAALCLQNGLQDAPVTAATEVSAPDGLPSPPSSPHKSESHGAAVRRPLFLVGDPKQAIYSFRGGDLRTYMTARACLRTLATQGQAQGLGLDANYRSRATLIQALNAVFAHEAWFGPSPETPHDAAWHLPSASDDIVFTPVHAGRRATEDEGGPAVFLRDFCAIEQEGKEKNDTEKKPRKADVEKNVRAWIVSRIVTGIRSGAKPGDFAVLTRGNAEGQAIARLLRRRGLACRIRQKSGPFQGPAADALRLLLEWIDDAASPDAQARILLLPFARRDESDLPKGRPERCPPLIARWAALAHAGRWPEFLTAVLYEGGYRTRLAADSESEAVRFDRLVERLSEAGSAPGTTARALCDRFDALRRGEDDVEDDGSGDVAASEQNAVTVMTLHLSKGLEFRHVFIAATGGGAQDDFLVLRDPGTTGFRIALDTGREDQKAQSDEQAHEENKRLFYVAFTRAKETLHVPLLPESFFRGDSGPLGGFVAQALRAQAKAADASAQSVQNVQFDTDEVMLENVTQDLAAAASAVPTERLEAPDRERMLAEARAAFSRRRTLTSYSKLAHRAGEVATAELLLEDDGTRAQRQEVVEDARDDEKEPETEHRIEPAPGEPGITAAELPPGAAAGTALHALLEHTSFASARETDSPDAWLALPGVRVRVEDALRRESVDTACAPAAARAVWNALRSPLPLPRASQRQDDETAGETTEKETHQDITFRLADIPAEDIRHEVEFLMAFGESTTSVRGALPDLPEGVVRKATANGIFLWGFIDLVYRRDGRYYLLDWKSNLLDAYDTDAVIRSMDRHHYHLQWKLYAVALDRWLTRSIAGYDPARHFGGVHYLYLRGASPDRFSGFATRPTVHDLRTKFPAEISRLLGGPLISPAPQESL